MSKEPEKQKEHISEALKDLVIERLDIIPPHKEIHIGSAGVFTKDELIDCVRREDEIGQKIVEIEISFLRALKEGTLLEEINKEE